MIGEFDLIQNYFTQASQNVGEQGVVLGVGDDCAVLEVPAGQNLVLSIDTLVAGTHFLPDTRGAQVASRLVGACVSDLAAMGADPRWMTLALTLPHIDEAWVKDFAQQLFKLLAEHKMVLIGGDTTKGPLALSAQVHGFVPSGRALTRKGAKAGDLICATGTLGDSHGGLRSLLNELPDSLPDVSRCYLESRFFEPTPRVDAGLALRGLASSCIDVSDGLLSDLGHILKASDVGAHIDVDALPISPELIEALGEKASKVAALTGGEDFELCFTLPAQCLHHLTTLGVPATVLGCITERKGVTGLDGLWLTHTGFDHFS